jgi:transposase-like protein
MDERLRFVAKLLDGEAMTEVCREFGISRTTGYKIFARYSPLAADRDMLTSPGRAYRDLDVASEAAAPRGNQ